MNIYQNTKTHVHHIIPRRKGGTDDPSNLVELTIYDHAIAHRNLWKLYGEKADHRAYLWLLKIADAGDELYENLGEKITVSNKKRYEDPKERIKTSEGSKRNWSDPEFRDKTTKAIKSSLTKSETIIKKSEAAKAQWNDPEKRNKMILARKGRIQSPETRAKISAARKKYFEDLRTD